MKKIICILIILLFLSITSYGFRIGKPPRFTKLDDPVQITQLNNVLEDLWNITNGRYNINIVTTNPNGSFKGDVGNMLLLSTGGNFYHCENTDGSTSWGCTQLGLFGVSDTTAITAAGGITVTNRVMRIQGSGGAIDITANPQIADSTDGFIVILQGDSDTNTVKLEDGTGLALAGAVSFTMGKGDVIQLTYDLGDDIYYECYRSDN